MFDNWKHRRPFFVLYHFSFVRSDVFEMKRVSFLKHESSSSLSLSLSLSPSADILHQCEHHQCDRHVLVTLPSPWMASFPWQRLLLEQRPSAAFPNPVALICFLRVHWFGFLTSPAPITSGSNCVGATYLGHADRRLPSLNITTKTTTSSSTSDTSKTTKLHF
jgi:hypothetical protein